jgi:hypothetical protein
LCIIQKKANMSGSIAATLIQAAKSRPLLNALRVPAEKIVWTHRDLDTFASALATGFLEQRLAGTRVASLIPHARSESVTLALAAALSGTTLLDLSSSPLNTKNADSSSSSSNFSEIARVLRDAGAKTVFVPTAAAADALSPLLSSNVRIVHAEPLGKTQKPAERLRDFFVYGPFPAAYSPLKAAEAQLSEQTPVLVDAAGKQRTHGEVLEAAQKIATTLGQLKNNEAVSLVSADVLPATVGVILAQGHLVLGDKTSQLKA